MENKENDLELLKAILATKMELGIANRNFEISDPELVDYYSYQIKASKAKLDYLIKQVKQKGISLDILNNLKLRIEERKII